MVAGMPSFVDLDVWRIEANIAEASAKLSVRDRRLVAPLSGSGS